MAALMIGHNQPSFDDIVQENLARGLLLGIKDAYTTPVVPGQRASPALNAPPVRGRRPALPLDRRLFSPVTLSPRL